jgi:AcrR family transcriptional regulator
VDDISAELHISKKTIYQYFSTKEEIFYYVVSRIARQYLRRMERDLARFATYGEKLAQLVRLIFAEAKKWLKENDAFEFRYKYEIGELAFKDAYGELLQTLVKQGIESKEFSQAPVELTTRLIQGMIAESIRLVTANPDLEVEDHLTESILKLLK